MSNGQKYKCIIFDCDGVLVDSVSITSQALLDLLQPLGAADRVAKVIDQYRGTPLHTAFHDIEDMMGHKLPDDFLTRYRELIYTRLKRDVQPIPGVRQLLENINMPFCVASGGPPEKIRLTLETTQLLPYFEGRIFSSYIVKSWKPDPGIFLHAASQMGFQSSQCLVVEDSLEGVEAATKGGFDVVGFVQDGYVERMKGTGATIIHSMTELHKWINQ